MKAGRAWKLEQSRIQPSVSAATGGQSLSTRGPRPPAPYCGVSAPPHLPRRSRVSLSARCSPEGRGVQPRPLRPLPTEGRLTGLSPTPRAWPATTPPRTAAARTRPEGHAGRRENGDGSASWAPRSLLFPPTSRARRWSTHRGSPSALTEPCARKQPLAPSSRRLAGATLLSRTLRAPAAPAARAR